MDLIIPDPGYDHPDVDGEAALAETERAARELFPEVDRRSANIGRGADFPVEILTLGGLFFLGEHIKNNLDAWLNLGKRFKRFIERQTATRRLDPIGADLVLLGKLQEQFSTVQSLDRLFENEIIAWEVDWYPKGAFERCPDRLYVRGFRVNGSRIVIAGLASSGVVSFWHEYSDEFRMLLGGETDGPG
jgi:hypothetical protein